MSKRRRFSGELKAKIALEAPRGDRTLQEIASKHQVHPNQVSTWKRQMRRIDELFLKYPFYGARQMVRHLRREGVHVGRRRAGRLMRLMGLQAIYRAPRTSDPHPEHRVYPYLLRGLTIERANHVWCADITGRLQAAGIRVSMDGRGRCMDNIFIERLWRSLKYEAIYLREIADGQQGGVVGAAGGGDEGLGIV